VTAALRVVERNWFVYRRTWRGSLFITFVSPVLFLGALGFGLGGLVDRSAGASGGAFGAISYAVFLAPGLLAAQAMQTAAFESSFPTLAKIHWRRTYSAMLATPLTVRDLLVGDLAWTALRLAMVGAAFLAVMAVLGLISSPLAILALPITVLTGLAFASLIVAFAATQKGGNGFSYLFRFVITPLFLFSGTFFPIEQLPPPAQVIAYLTPLYHGTALTRGLILGPIDPLAGLGHAAVLLVYASIGLALADRLLRRRLAP